MSDKISLIDTHFHLDKYQNHSSLYELMNKNHQYTLCVTCSPGVFLSCKKLYPETKYVKFALGVHPKEITDPEKSIHEFNICLHQAKYIGEIGLDYSGASPSRDIQLNVFRHIIKKQAERNMLATIHVKKAEEDLITVLGEYPSSKRIIHWFSGNSIQMSTLLSQGCYFSINASMAQSESGKKRIAMIPKDRILIESDGPYSKVDGKRYTPEKLTDLYRTVGCALQVNNLEEIVYRNFLNILSQ